MQQRLGICHFIIGILIAANLHSQDDVESNFGVNLQLFGAGLNYELTVDKAFTVNSLVFYEAGFFQGLDGDVRYIATTTFGLEPRWYHNRKRRSDKGKNIAHNVGNYLSGELFYVSDVLSSSNDNRVDIDPGVVVGVKYGLRRNIVDNIHFELAFGVGQVFAQETENYTSPLLDIKFQYILF